MTAKLEAIVAGERLELLAERAIHWPRPRTLIVADVHWGKDDAFRAESIPVPAGTLQFDLERLRRLVHDNDAERLLILGDLWHSRSGITESLIDTLRDWRQTLSALSIELVRGNHDVLAAPHHLLNIAIADEDRCEAPFAFRHHPCDSPDGYVLAGHVHPAVTLRGEGKQKLRLPCFWFGKDVGILPAFGRFTGMGDVTPKNGDQVFVIAEGEVIAVR